jgi:hypothetical protein
MALASSKSSGPSGQQRAAGYLPRLRSGIQLGEASSRPPECLVQLLWVGEEGHHQGVDHREPTQPLLFVATQRRREHQVQMLKECKDGLVVHHEAACLATSPLVDRALPTVRLLQLRRIKTPQSWRSRSGGLAQAGDRRCRSLQEPTTSSPASWLLCWSGRHGGGRRPGRPGPASSAASAATRPALLRPGGWSPQPSATAGRSQPETQAGTADECVAPGLLSGGQVVPSVKVSTRAGQLQGR